MRPIFTQPTASALFNQAYSQTPVVQGFHFSVPGFKVANGQVFIHVDHSSEIDVATQAWQRAEWALRKACPADREAILVAIGNDTRIGLDPGALRETLWLTPQQLVVLRAGFALRPLRQLIAQQALPKASNADVWRDVVNALKQEVFCDRECLSIDDVWTLAHAAVVEMVRRGMADALEHGGVLVEMLTSDSDMNGCFNGRTRSSDPWINGEMGSVEACIADQLQRIALANHALPPLLIARARSLDLLLGLALVEASRVKPPDLAMQIKGAFEQLLAQSFTLGEDGPQDIHQACLHYVVMALDKLGAHDVPAVGTPSQHEVQQALLTVGQPKPSRKRDAGQMALPAAPDVQIHQPAQQVMADELNKVVAARALLAGPLELQDGVRCLQHACNNGSYYWLKLNQPGGPWRGLSLENIAHELVHIDGRPGPDGWPMKVVSWRKAQVQALMPELEAHLDLAIVLQGNPDVDHRNQQEVDRIRHFVALVMANGMHFELDSLAPDAESGKKWIKSLAAYFDKSGGGVVMAIRGAPHHPLSKYVTLLNIETFYSTCEALGVFMGKQPIVELAQRLPAEGMQAAAHSMGIKFVAEFWGDHRSSCTARQLEFAEGVDRGKAIVDALDRSSAKQAIVWTGTAPMVMAVKRKPGGLWIARVFGKHGYAWPPLAEVLHGQESLFQGLDADERQARRGFADILVLAADESSAGPARNVVQPKRALPSPTTKAAPSVPPLSEDPLVIASQRVLLLALKSHVYAPKQAALAPLANMETVQDVVDFLLGLPRNQWRILFTIATHLKETNEKASQHLVTLCLIGANAFNALPWLPFEMPPALRFYADLIKKNLDRWTAKTHVPEIKKRLGL